MVYDINGNGIADSFLPTAMLQTGIHEGTFYYFLRILKKKPDGTFQYPFVVASNGTSATEMSALDYALLHNNYVTINSGLGNQSGNSWVPLGILIQNGVVIQDTQTSFRPLVVSQTGDLYSVNPDTTAASLVASGIKSALCAFGPIVEDYVAVSQESYPHINWSANAQRQIIGQFSNGDYAIITCEGRGYDNSIGWTIPQAQSLCTSLNLKFAYNLDGGGSTETVVGKKQLNTIYENTTGRTVCSFIIFNGTDNF